MKITAAWPSQFEPSMLPALISSAQQMGFDSFAWTSNKHEERFIEACEKSKILPIKVIAPLKTREGARTQVLMPSDHELLQSGTFYQYGGEPLLGSKEILNQPLLCPLEESIVTYVTNQVEKSLEKGFKAICWDFIGYQNYCSCSCITCVKSSIGRNKDEFYEESLIDLQDKLYLAVKSKHASVPVISHNHPVFLPNPFYAQKAMLDYCAMTVSWFFQPHWDLEKVASYIHKTLHGAYKYPFSKGMPMFGFYGLEPLAMHAKSLERIEAELRIWSDSKSNAIMYAELSNMLAHSEIRDKIQNHLNQS